jgi:hypothetical protein
MGARRNINNIYGRESVGSWFAGTIMCGQTSAAIELDISFCMEGLAEAVMMRVTKEL